MLVDRAMSHNTFKDLEESLWNIHRMADQRKDFEYLKLSDRAIVLLQRYSGHIFMEDEKAGITQERSL